MKTETKSSELAQWLQPRHTGRLPREAPAAKRSTNSACGRLQDAIVMCRYLCPGWWLSPTPLKNDGVGQLG